MYCKSLSLLSYVLSAYEYLAVCTRGCAHYVDARIEVLGRAEPASVQVVDGLSCVVGGCVSLRLPPVSIPDVTVTV